jgi:hypothetical protein
VHSSVYVTINVVGWVAMVNGQSMVLWSRLHLLLHDQFYLKLILGLIITTALICHPPIIAMKYGASSGNPDRWLRPFTIYEKVQVTLFFLQECVISGCYIVQIIKLLRTSREMYSRQSSRRLLLHLILVNIAVVMLDIGILGLEYAGRYDVQTSYKSFAYSVKLKMEFIFLNRLVELVQHVGERTSPQSTPSNPPGTELVSVGASSNCAAGDSQDSGVCQGKAACRVQSRDKKQVAGNEVHGIETTNERVP